MPTTQQEFSETYRNLSEPEIAALYAQVDTLTDAARTALKAEMQRRGLSGAHLSKLHAAELRHEALFDRLQNQRRKSLASYLLFRDDPKGTIVAILAGLAIIAILMLIAHRH